jgi:SAM-dependent methyltransferase
MPDALRVARAIATNQLARFAPGAYIRLTGQTGRGGEETESVADIAGYFRGCFDDYFRRLSIEPEAVGAYLAGKTLVEYGPGDLPAVAALMLAHGAEKVYCVDRFPLVRLDGKNVRVLADLVRDLPAEGGDRIRRAMVDRSDASAGFDARCIEYLVRPNGTVGLSAVADLVFSRAVLEHVNDLEATMADMVQAMRPGAVAIHLVDLRSHGLHRDNPLDFLQWPPALWDLMYSAKGVPNRWRVDRYREALARLPIDVLQFEITRQASLVDVQRVRPHLARPFRGISDEDLACLGFWLVFRKRGG